MSTFRSALENTKLAPEYSHITADQTLLGRLGKKIFEYYCKALFSIYCPLNIYGKANIPDSSYIFCSNHNSHMDSGVLMIASGRDFKNFAMIAAKDYFFENKTRKFFLNILMNLIPVDRKSNRKTITEYLVACREFVNKDQRCLVIYPEGTRSLTGEMQPFKRGLAIVSVELGIPILPAFIEGTNKALPKGRNLMKPVRLSIHIGEPIYPEEFLKNSENSKNANISPYAKVTKELENRIHKLKDRKIIEKECQSNEVVGMGS